MKSRLSCFVLKLAALASIALPSWAVPVIDNRTPTPGTVSPFGYSAYGQVFIPTGAETILDGFTFSLQKQPDYGTSFQAFIQRFDTTTHSAAGNILFTSAVFSTALGNYELEEFTFNTAGLQLASNTTYIAYLSTALLSTGFGGPTRMASVSHDPTNPNLGNFHFVGGGFDSSTGYANSWNPVGSVQASFSANFSPPPAAGVPEIDASAATLPLAAAFIALLVTADRRQLQKDWLGQDVSSA